MHLTPPPSLGMLVALNARRRHIYAGTVDPVEVTLRRRANRRARAARRGTTVTLGPSPREQRRRAHRAAMVAQRSTWSQR